MRFTEEQGERYQSIIEFLSPPDGTAISSAKIAKELEWDPSNTEAAVRDLIAFGELELINISQHGRVRLRRPPPSTKEQATLSDPTEYVWYGYITEQDGLGRSRARRLFDNREAGEEHLRQITGENPLVSVPGAEDVWCTSTTGNEGYKQEYAVLRREPIFAEADHPYPEFR
jgi:hypothetical protein